MGAVCVGSRFLYFDITGSSSLAENKRSVIKFKCLKEKIYCMSIGEVDKIFEVSEQLRRRQGKESAKFFAADICLDIKVAKDVLF